MSVIGTGYLGAVHAVCMAVLGHDVVGVDRDEVRVSSLSKGVVPFFEPGLEELLDAALASGRLRFTTDIALANDAEIHFLCVGTPQSVDSQVADLSQLKSALLDLLPAIRTDSLIVGKSTVPVGTARSLRVAVSAFGAPCRIGLAWNPEFLREGHAIEDTLGPDRLVF
ncbi:MAG: UDP-glucose 6-dehydrogenase, partial [Nocardioides sp.]